jgi:hypothetical protein
LSIWSLLVVLVAVRAAVEQAGLELVLVFL